jgi:transcriptional regulator with XRE-family HTH domain
MAKNRIRLSDQVRRAVDASGRSRYSICKDAGIDQATFSRFMAGKVGLAMTTLDDLADVLGLDILVSGPAGRAKTRTGGNQQARTAR